ncbi:MAG TPA: hypothetical protein VK324_13395, partial [Tepidisphaeraceae bacterium]|nr:hypothetical protein [Tepidisphaeraceae bacterium]
ITAGADLMGPGEAIVIGLISGVLVVFSVLFFDKIRIDDPVGALSVHLVCGIFGTLAVGIFGDKGILRGENGGAQLTSQLIGIVAIGVATFVLSLVIFAVLKAVSGIRVGAEEEMEGLDIGEHGMHAYPDFTTDVVTSGPSSTSTAVSGKMATV